MLDFKKRWPMMEKWTEFISKQNAITKGEQHKAKILFSDHNVLQDTWNMFFLFTKKCPKDLSTYDQDDAWPTLIDEFVDSQLHPNKKDEDAEMEED